MLFAELLAVRFDLELALNRHINKVVLEPNSLMAVKELTKIANSFYQWGRLVRDTVNLQGFFRYCKVSYVCRLANKFAHNLPKFSKESEDYSCWVGHALSFCYNPDMN